MNQNQLTEARFWVKVTKKPEPGCWLWTAATSRNGYGKFYINGKFYGAHRVAYTWLVGAIGPGLQLDHLCRVHNCVNPAHLEPVTCRTNLLRGIGPTAKFAAQTHCKHGHKFTPENTYRYSGNNGRYCRTCHRNVARTAYQRKVGLI